ncbi:MAG: outer membrane lipoprotein chaperone LolA [Woeseiaceae bacterium]|nr:outer membrane lipoprotein chaperone LolA [Woeseiaceae bacterium]
MIRTTFAAMLLATLTPAVAADADIVDVGQSLVDDFVTNVSTFSADFEQTLIDPEGAMLERSSGRLDIRRPGQFRWVYDEPYEQWLVADGRNIWSYDVDLAQVTVKAQTEALANTPALLLGGSDEALDEFVFDGSYDKNGLTWVRMRPVTTDSGFYSLELGFADGKLTQMKFYDNLDQTTIVALENVVVNAGIDRQQFEFTVPAGVDVVGTPAAAVTETP